MNSDLRQASWTNTTDESIEDSSFAQRDGTSTDVVSDLRKADDFYAVEEPIYDGQEVIIETDSTLDTDAILAGPQTIIKIFAADAAFILANV